MLTDTGTYAVAAVHPALALADDEAAARVITSTFMISFPAFAVVFTVIFWVVVIVVFMPLIRKNSVTLSLYVTIIAFWYTQGMAGTAVALNDACITPPVAVSDIVEAVCVIERVFCRFE